MNDIFKLIEKSYSLRTISHFRSSRIRTTKYGVDTPSNLGPKLWNLDPNEYKTIESLADFNAKKVQKLFRAGYKKHTFTK